MTYLSLCRCSWSKQMIHLQATTARKILDSMEAGTAEIEISLDLGLTTQRVVLSQQNWDLDDLRKISENTDSVYFITEDGTFEAAIRGRHFYKLHSTGESSPPALLIDGVLMHRVKDVSPVEDAEMKARLCARRGADLLEVCTGLGYSTIACLDMGVRSIVTIERDHEVIDLARVNPWSKRLFTDERVRLIDGDAVEKVQSFEGSMFDSILHDPPRFSMSPELYTAEFYSQLWRVMRPKGILYHYVGTPGAKHGRRDMQKGIMTRLRVAGFRDVSRDEGSLGVTARRA